MKNITLLVLALALHGCSENIPAPENRNPCSTPAIVRDLSGLDGCGFIFELGDGTRLEPVRVLHCGTPPLPKEITEDPLHNFEFVDGKRVLISYTPAGAGSFCMAGTLVSISCISEEAAPTPER